MFAQLSPENEAFIEQGIASGVFTSREEALDAGIAFLREHKRLLDRLDESRRQLDQGEFVEHNEQSLSDYFAQLKDRAQKQGEAKRNGS